MKSPLQRQELLIDANSEPPLYIQTDILLFVLIGDSDLLAVRQKVVVRYSAKSIVLHRKCLIKHTIDVIVPAVAWGMGYGEWREERICCEQGMVVIGDRCKDVYQTRGSVGKHMSGVRSLVGQYSTPPKKHLNRANYMNRVQIKGFRRFLEQ